MMQRMYKSPVVLQFFARFCSLEVLLRWKKHPSHMFDWLHVLLNQFVAPSASSSPLFFPSLIYIFEESKVLHNAFAQTTLLSNRFNGEEKIQTIREIVANERYAARNHQTDRSICNERYRWDIPLKKRSTSVGTPATVGVALSQSTLKRKLNEISNRQELPRIGPIKPPPVPRAYTRVY